MTFGRPKKPNLTELEHEATKHLGTRLAATEISKLRGGSTYPERRVSHSWVGVQRRKLEGRNETPTGRKDDWTAYRKVRGLAEKYASARAIRDPLPHQEGENPTFPNPDLIVNRPGREAAAPSPIGLKENGQVQP